MLAPFAFSFPGKFFNHAAQMIAMRLQRFDFYTMNINQLMIVAIDKIVCLIEYIRETAGHTRTDVHAGWAEHLHYTTGHRFTAVITPTFRHHKGTRVTHATPFTGSARGRQFT